MLQEVDEWQAGEEVRLNALPDGSQGQRGELDLIGCRGALCYHTAIEVDLQPTSCTL